MKIEEQIASKFLATRFGAEPTYEPLGRHLAPDFCIKRVAFEIRRLNQRYFHEDGRDEGLEQVDYRLNAVLRRELDKIAFWDDKGSFFWGLSFRRPLRSEPRKIAKQLAAAARSHYLEGSRKTATLKIDEITLDLMPATIPHGKAFAMGYVADGDSGGFLGDIYPCSIRLALEEKIVKTMDIAGQFDRWALILIDTVLPGVTSPNDIGPMDFDLQHFSSIAILNPNGSLSMEFPGNSLRDCEPYCK